MIPDRLTVDKELRKFYLTEGYAISKGRLGGRGAFAGSGSVNFITFTVEEGERYKLSKVDIRPRSGPLDPLALQGDLTTHEATEHASRSTKQFRRSSDRVGSLGYAFVDVRPRIDRDAKTTC